MVPPLRFTFSSASRFLRVIRSDRSLRPIVRPSVASCPLCRKRTNEHVFKKFSAQTGRARRDSNYLSGRPMKGTAELFLPAGSRRKSYGRKLRIIPLLVWRKYDRPSHTATETRLCTHTHTCIEGNVRNRGCRVDRLSALSK